MANYQITRSYVGHHFAEALGANSHLPSLPPKWALKSRPSPILPLAPSRTAERAWGIRPRCTQTLLPSLRRPGRPRAQRALPGAKDRAHDRGSAGLKCSGYRQHESPDSAGCGERRRDSSSPGTGVSGTHLSPGCSLWKKERTW